MIATFILWAALQGIPIAPQAGGTLSGVLKNADGKPAVGVRVSARTHEESLAAIALASLAETDQQGRYTIENIPPGQYYIVAGSIDRPTYYPGTQERSGARILQITPGIRITGFDFTVSESSQRQVMTTFFGGPPRLQVNVRLLAETGVRLPASSAAGAVTLQVERVAGGAISSVPSGVSVISLDLTPPADYRITMANLPEGFAVKAITYGGVDIGSGILKIPSATSVSSASNAAGTGLLLSGLSTIPGDTLTIVIGEVTAGTRSASAGGVRVTGVGRLSDTHPVYLSGQRGTVFSDGTFEFRNVPRGRHVIASIDFPGRARGATLIVGDRDIDNVELEDIAALPLDIQTPQSPGPVGVTPPGSKIAPVVLRGLVLDQATGQPPASGQVFISGRSGPSHYFDSDGMFEVVGLLPGTYRVVVQVAGYPDAIRELKADIEDIRLEIQIAK